MIVGAENIIKSSLIDDVIYSTDIFSLPEADYFDLQNRIISDYVNYTISENKLYYDFVSKKDSKISVPGSLPPPIPTSAFKNRSIVNCEFDNIEKWCLSSGTTGTQSQIGRDVVSLERLLGTVRCGMTLFEDWHEEDISVIHLGPRYENAGDIWFPYVMALTELLYPTESFGVDNFIDIPAAVDLFADKLSRGERVGIIGAPFAVREFATFCESRGLSAGNSRDVYIVTAGGWKREAATAVERTAFQNWLVASLGLHDSRQVRDAFNQVELNTVIFECEAHSLHLPIWVHATARSHISLEPLPPGETGLLSFIDASASSWPCIIVGDDVGHISDTPCRCGRPGHILKFERRIERGVGAGCALHLAQHYAVNGQ